MSPGPRDTGEAVDILLVVTNPGVEGAPTTSLSWPIRERRFD